MTRDTSTIISEIHQHFFSSAKEDRKCKIMGCPNSSKTGMCQRCLTNELKGHDKTLGRANLYVRTMEKAAKLEKELMKRAKAPHSAQLTQRSLTSRVIA